MRTAFGKDIMMSPSVSQGELEELRAHRVKTLDNLAASLVTDKDAIISLLQTVEPLDTAVDEFDRATRALRTYDVEVPALTEREPFGKVAVALPFNNPLYSLILYCCGPSIGGSSVMVRPSSLTKGIVYEIVNTYPEYFKTLAIETYHRSGAEFLGTIESDPEYQTLLFTGSYENMTAIRPRLSAKGMIYCGSGINPFIVGADSHDRITTIARRIVSSRFFNSGQDCLCTERAYFHKEIATELIDEIQSQVSSLTAGPFGSTADICPLVPTIAQRASSLTSKNYGAEHEFVVRGSIDGNLVTPSVIRTPLDSPLLSAEKFAPILTFATYSTDEELKYIAKSDFRFGASVTNQSLAGLFHDYPHIAIDGTVIQLESDDAHQPFGGRGNSGFSTRGAKYRDGPILYGYETTFHKEANYAIIDLSPHEQPAH